MGARQIAEAHQELAGDLATREGEGAAEQLHPFHLRQRMVGVEPSLEAAMTVAKQAYAASVFNRRVDLRAVAYDFGIAEQPCPIRGTVCGDPVHVDSGEGRAKGLPVSKYETPYQPRPGAFHHHPFPN